jgi:hypothetical protein
MYNGTPGLRIWQIGTRYLLGLGADPDSPEDDIPALPRNLRHVFKPFGNLVYGDFEVCLLQRYRKGHMQPAHLIAGKHLVVRSH